MKAPVYINWGRAVIDCPVPHCGDAREVELGQKMVTCIGGHTSDLEWAPDIPQVLVALKERTSDKRKNWFPKNHPLAVALGQPHGQTVAQLRAEAKAGEEADAAKLAEDRKFVLSRVRELDIPVEQVLAALKGT